MEDAIKKLSAKHFVHKRGTSFIAKHMSAKNPMENLDLLEGGIIFTKMVIVRYYLLNGVVLNTNEAKSLATLSNTSIEAAALVTQTIPNESIQNKIEAAQFVNKMLQTIFNRMKYVMP